MLALSFHLYMGLCWLRFWQLDKNWAILEKGASMEKMLPSSCPIGKYVGSFLNYKSLM